MKRIQFVLITAVALLSACKSSTLVGAWAPAEALKPPAASEFPKADAVVLFDERRVQFATAYTGDDFRTQEYYHSAIVVLNEEGLEAADGRISITKKAKLRDFRARTITPDGQIHEVGPAAIHDDEGKGSTKNSEYTVRVFAFPKAQVGAILEVRYIIDIPWIPTSYSQVVSRKHPVRDYRVEFLGTDDIRYRVKAYNVDSSEPWKLIDNGGDWQLDFKMTDVDAHDNESYAGAKRTREPRWIFNVQGFIEGRYVWHRNSDWNHAVEWPGGDLYGLTGERYAGFDPKIDFSKCGDVRCKLKVALAWLNENLPLSDWKDLPGRKLAEVMTAKEATDVEKNRALWKILDGIGVKARFGLMHGYLNGALDEEFPDPSNFDRIALLLPVQDGIDQPVWVDAACEFCAVGEIPYWLRDVRAVVVDYEYEELSSEPTYKATFDVIKGKPATRSSYHHTYRATIDPSGDIAVRATFEGAADAAMEERRKSRHKKKDDHQKQAEAYAKKRIEQSTIQRHEPIAVDTDTWTSKRVVDFSASGYAVPDKDELIVPLSFFTGGLDAQFKGKTKNRQHPIRVTQPYVRTEEAFIRVPRGYEVTTKPESASSTGPFDVKIEVAQTGDTIHIRRTVSTDGGLYPVERYPEFKKAAKLFRSVREKALTFKRTAEAPLRPVASDDSAPGSAARPSR